MSVKRSRPGNPAVRKGRNVGPDYPDDRFTNPTNAGIDKQYGSRDEKTLCGPTATTVDGAGLPHHDKYDEYWEGK